VSWGTPTSIVYGTPLSATQLDATANIAGTLTYSPVAGTVLTVGTTSTHNLNVTFTPTDTTDYKTVMAHVIQVITSATTTTANTGTATGTSNATRHHLTVDFQVVGQEGAKVKAM
jgi:hypothetical protein